MQVHQLCLLILSFHLHQGYAKRHNEDSAHDFSKLKLGSGRSAADPTKSNVAQEEKENDFWINNALRRVEHWTQHVRPNTKKAKNIILFLGDGMGVSTHTAARVYQGQLKGQRGEENTLFFETLPYSGLSKTYCVDAQVPDSACTSTAYTNGVKASIGTMGLNGKVALNNCKGSKNESSHTESIVSWAIKAGKSTGIVTTTRITHASPGAAYAHVANRNWECDTDRPYHVDCQDIASQLVHNYPGNKINVLFGGGLSKFQNTTQGGKRKDEDLLAAYEANRKKNNETYKIVKTKKELLNINSTDDFVLGLFNDDHLKYELEKLGTNETEPTLTDMVKKAVEILSKNKNGFYLFVEGGRIDLGHHANQAKKALTETIELDNAIRTAHHMTNPDDTLIVVTADHSHTFTISGYPDRGSPILGKAKWAGRDILGKDKLPYLTLGYNNGPGFVIPDENKLRHNVNEDITDDDDYKIPVGIPLDYETHGGEDVAVYSKGPWSHLLVGSFEQNYIPVVMAYAARIGPGAKLPLVSNAPCMSVSGGNTLYTLLMSLLMMVISRYLTDK